MYDQNQIINLKCFDFKGFEILLSILLGRGVLPSHSLNSIAITAGGKAVVTGKGVVPAALLSRVPVMSSAMRSEATNGVETSPIGRHGV